MIKELPHYAKGVPKEKGRPFCTESSLVSQSERKIIPYEIIRIEITETYEMGMIFIAGNHNKCLIITIYGHLPVKLIPNQEHRFVPELHPQTWYV